MCVAIGVCFLDVRVCLCVCVNVVRLMFSGSQAGIDQHSLNKQKGREEEDNLKTKD